MLPSQALSERSGASVRQPKSRGDPSGSSKHLERYANLQLKVNGSLSSSREQVEPAKRQLEEASRKREQHEAQMQLQLRHEAEMKEKALVHKLR